MLFNSNAFLFLFLPLALACYQVAAHFGRRAVVLWLSAASLAFYAWWRPAFLLVLLGSILFNYLMGRLISRANVERRPVSWLLAFTIAIDLGALCFYKYLFPMLNFVGRHSAGHRSWGSVFLPLGISFFTFTQIAYLVDLADGEFTQHGLADYTLFATFFPHLIAGPILHHSEMMPQFQRMRDFRLRADDLSVGFAWFVLGLLKKVLLADRFAPAADAAFFAPHFLSSPAAWCGSLAYALQLYFDFSGYSDMALGLARMFSIDFPLNFSSPYKATNIIDFWQRWHMTLTRYINQYIYNPIAVRITRWRVSKGLKSSRKAMATPSGFAALIATPTVITLFLAGVWHGAGLQFIVFGLLHALYLTINHGWRIFRGPATVPPPASATVNTRSVRAYLTSAGSCLLTFAAVLLAQVFFRANSLRDGLEYTRALFGLHRAVAEVPSAHLSHSFMLSLVAGLVIVWCFPNTQQILARFKPALELTGADRKPVLIPIAWKPTAAWNLSLGLLLFIAMVKMQDPSTFLYFQF